MTYAFLDTNVLLHYKLFREIDWCLLLQGETTLVFTPVVLKELDTKKWSGSRKEKQRSKTVLKALDELGLSNAPIELRRGTAAVAASTEPRELIFKDHDLQPSVGDDRLLASLLAFVADNVNSRIVLVTADAGLRVKARTQGIELVQLDDALALPEEQDAVELELARVTRELAALQSSAPDLRITIGGESHISVTIHPAMPFADSTRSDLLRDWLSPYTALVGLAGIFVSDSGQINSQAARLCERYLDDWHKAYERRCLSIPLDFLIDNVGSSPAEDIHLEFRTEDQGQWHESAPGMPKPPDLPSLGFGSSILGYVERDFPRDFPHIYPIDRDVDGPSLDDEDPSAVRFWVRRANQHVPFALDTVHFQLGSREDVRSFKISYRLAAANIRAPLTGELHVVLKLGEPTPPPDPPRPYNPNKA